MIGMTNRFFQFNTRRQAVKPWRTHLLRILVFWTRSISKVAISSRFIGINRVAVYSFSVLPFLMTVNGGIALNFRRPNWLFRKVSKSMDPNVTRWAKDDKSLTKPNWLTTTNRGWFRTNKVSAIRHVYTIVKMYYTLYNVKAIIS